MTADRAALPPYDHTPVTTTDGLTVVGWSWPPAPVVDVPPRCKCSHPQRNHGTDHRDRATCFGSAVCGCTTYRPEENPVSNDPDLIEPEVRQYRVTLTGDAREVYIVEAASADEARERWDVDGFLDHTECSGMELVSVEVDE